MEKIYQVYGSIIKKTSLTGIDKDICKKFCILYTEQPYPGYYQTPVPSFNSLLPHSLFFVTKNKIDDEIIFRLAKKIKAEKNINLDIAPAEIVVQNITKNAIRIKKIENFSQIKEIANFLIASGIKFDNSKHLGKYDGLIKIRKMFQVKEISDGEWFDTRDNGLAYFRTPKSISWDEFEKKVKIIKNNVEDNIFDAALGYFFINFEIVDIIRIYDPKINIEKIYAIRDAFLKELDK